LESLALERRVSAATQNQALSALLFLVEKVLEAELGDIDAVRAKRSRHLPEVLSREEVKRLLAATGGITGLLPAASLRYRSEANGGPAPAGQGCESGTADGHGAQRKGRQGPAGDATGSAPCGDEESSGAD
ncbi:MAG TPA: phage integrase N-terminal SAM-like domain-containing protein, partial [Verrucomicrobiales bacterium]|nr:phage integrase N-terminal SAM-like domain-containing protein [Verrucomicrobiales bacterium]